MKTTLWLALSLGLGCGAASIGPSPQWDPVPQGDSFQLDKRGGQGQGNARPINIDLAVWKPNGTKLQWYGEIAVGTPPQKL